MTWTYSGNPAANERDAVRFLVADTDSTDPLITDEEIAYLLVLYTEAPHAAVGAARAIAAKFSRDSDQARGIGDLNLSESLSQKSTQYHHLGDHLAGLASGITLPPIPVANSGALGAELTIGLLDKFTL
jgi:hypothetical protein